MDFWESIGGFINRYPFTFIIIVLTTLPISLLVLVNDTAFESGGEIWTYILLAIVFPVLVSFIDRAGQNIVSDLKELSVEYGWKYVKTSPLHDIKISGEIRGKKVWIIKEGEALAIQVVVKKLFEIQEFEKIKKEQISQHNTKIKEKHFKNIKMGGGKVSPTTKNNPPYIVFESIKKVKKLEIKEIVEFLVTLADKMH